MTKWPSGERSQRPALLIWTPHHNDWADRPVITQRKLFGVRPDGLLFAFVGFPSDNRSSGKRASFTATAQNSHNTRTTRSLKPIVSLLLRVNVCITERINGGKIICKRMETKRPKYIDSKQCLKSKVEQLGQRNATGLCFNKTFMVFNIPALGVTEQDIKKTGYYRA